MPFAQLAKDLAAHTLPNYGLIVPDRYDDAHECPSGITPCTTHYLLSKADYWLQSKIGPLIASSDFSTPGGGLLIITFDESHKSDLAMGGGHTVWVAVGPNVKRGYSSDTCYQHESTLNFMLEMLGLGETASDFPGTAATAPSMNQFISGN